ncbi:MAG: hypothetical protein RBQ91_06810 [Acholeplasma sp.]|nr:hypothetical protein [Acholeplasma sp.]
MPKLIKRVNLAIMIVMVLALFGCKKSTLSMLSPSGSPEYAIAYFEQDSKYEKTIVSGAEALIAGFNETGYDIIFAPTNLGAKLYHAKPVYQLIGVLTWGNYYLISDHSIDLESLDEIEVIAFGEKQIPEFILSLILSDYDIDYEVQYLDSLASVSSAFLLDSSKVYLVAEPSLSILKTKKSLTYIDLQLEYQRITNTTGYPQAGVFAHKDLSDKTLNQFKEDLDNAIKSLKTDPNAYEVLKACGISIDESIYQEAVFRSNIDFKESSLVKEALNRFYELIITFNDHFLGQLPDESFYR